MASYLQIENISKSYGPKVLFDHIGFNVNEGDKIALIAPNGTGKTSLMRILAGKDKSDSGGQIKFLKEIRIAFLEQDYDFDPEATLLEQVLAGSKPSWSISTPRGNSTTNTASSASSRSSASTPRRRCAPSPAAKSNAWPSPRSSPPRPIS